ncbi:MAG: aminopeptidase P family protein [Sinobacteraceae bacterium]|nr:aminopeptidase P family protein [Nevskiaceae bacterium]
MSTVETELAQAQARAAELFEAVVADGLIRPGLLESELSEEIHALARRRFGVRRHWHRRIVRCGANTLLGYHDQPAERRLEADDVVYLDFGPLFEEWEADYGRTYVLGEDPRKHQLVRDIEAAFAAGKRHYRESPQLSAGELYDYVCGLAREGGWEFGAPTAGHLIGHFPHETAPATPTRFSIRHGNRTSLREPDAHGAPRHWILEIHFVDRACAYGGFFEELLTI